MSQVKIISLLIHHHLWQQINKIICIIFKLLKQKLQSTYLRLN